MLKLKQTETYHRWLTKLADRKAKAIIIDRVFRLANGHANDVKPVGSGIYELRIHYGPGYRVYYRKQGTLIILLLCGGNKSSQGRDITTAKRIAEEIEHE